MINLPAISTLNDGLGEAVLEEILPRKADGTSVRGYGRPEVQRRRDFQRADCRRFLRRSPVSAVLDPAGGVMARTLAQMLARVPDVVRRMGVQDAGEFAGDPGDDDGRQPSELNRTDGVQVAVGVASNLGMTELQRFVPQGSSVVLVENKTHELMRHADAAMVTSGTATLETGWFCTPLVVVYKTSPISFLIGRWVVDVVNIGLVNIVAEKTVAPEFLQNEMTVENLVAAVHRILTDDAYRHTMKVELSQIRRKLGEKGASARVAEGIIELGEKG